MNMYFYISCAFPSP